MPMQLVNRWARLFAIAALWIAGALIFSWRAFVHASPVPIEVVVPSPYLITGSFQKMLPKVKNEGSEPITYCVDRDQKSFQGSLTQSTPTPFAVEAKIAGKWQPLRPHSDVDRLLGPAVLAAGDSKEYPFGFVGGQGPVRLVLTYWIGSHLNMDCEKPDRGALEARSPAVELIFVEH
jgi:hypothetical protein